MSAPRTPRARAPRPSPHANAAPSAAWLAPASWGVVALFAAAALAMVFGPHRVGDVFTETDFYGGYGPGARMLLAGRIEAGRYGVQGPLFEFAIAALGLVVRDLFVAAQLVAVAGMTAALACWRTLIARRVGAGAALVAVLLLALNAWWFRFAWSATTDALALGLQAGALLALAGAKGEGAPTLRRSAVAGLLAGLAYLTRYNYMVLLPAALTAIALGWTAVPRAERLRHALACTVGFLAPVAPWLLWWTANGGLALGRLHMNIAFEVYARPKGIPLDVFQRDLEPQFPTLWSVLSRDPGAVVARMFHNLGEHLWLDGVRVAGWPFALAAAAGAVWTTLDRGWSRMRPALAVWALLFLSLLPAPHSERYSLAVLPAWAWLAAGLFASPRFAFPVAGLWLRQALLVAVAAALLMTNMRDTRTTLKMLPVEVLEAAAQVRPLTQPGDRVFARKPHFAWYAGLQPATPPLTDSLADWGDLARRERVRWMYFSWPEAQLRPAFEWLLDTTSATPGLTVRAATAHWPAVVYEIGPRFGDLPAWAGSDTLTAMHRARARTLVNERDLESRLFLAMHHFSTGDHVEAQRWIDALLSLAPDNADFVLLAAENRLRLRDPAGASSYYDRLEALAPGTPALGIGRGWVALMSGDEVAAARRWAPLIGITETEEDLRQMRFTFERLGDVARAREVTARLVSLGYRP